jgi:sugar phosphate isomerase/epimerase
MKMSVSNIAWDKSNDEFMLHYLADNNIQGLEVAPTRLIESYPYDNLDIAIQTKDYIKKKFNLSISSIQSIWYGRKENIFRDENEYNILLNYTKKAIKFAEAVECPNIVFGCPRNRNIEDYNKLGIASRFFKEIGDYAKDRNTIIALEPNPVIYNTNFINTTLEAFEFVKMVNSDGVMVNVDLGTILYNNENLSDIFAEIEFINHIHISEPNLLQIEKRDIHMELSKILKKTDYNKYISLEMKNYNDIKILTNSIKYVNEVIV